MGKDDILSKAAILQRDQQTYAIMASLPGGVMDVASARRVAEAAEAFGVKTLKVTGAQRLALIGVGEQDIDAVYEATGISPRQTSALCQQYIKACPGNTFCSRGQKDTLAFTLKVGERFHPFPKINAKVKIGIAGCYNSCVEPAIKDIGLIGLPGGWTVMAGGAGGKEPMFAQIIAANLDETQTLELMERILKYYRVASTRYTTRNFRLGAILKKEGKGPLMRACGLDGD